MARQNQSRLANANEVGQCPGEQVGQSLGSALEERGSGELQVDDHGCSRAADDALRGRSGVLAEAEDHLASRHPLAVEHEHHPTAAALGHRLAGHDEDLLAALGETEELGKAALLQGRASPLERGRAFAPFAPMVAQWADVDPDERLHELRRRLLQPSYQRKSRWLGWGC